MKAAARRIGWLGFAAAFVVAVAGYPVRPHAPGDPGASFRCPPPLVSAWSDSAALEKVRAPDQGVDTEVNVDCRPSGQTRILWALSLAALGAIAVVDTTTIGDHRRTDAPS